MITLIKKELKSSYKIFFIFIGVISLYSSVIVAMYDPTLGESLHMMAEAMPQLFAAFGMSDPGVTLLDFLTNYLYGFILIVFPLIFSIIMCHRLMCRYIDKGSMAYLLSTPYNRFYILLSQYIVLVIGIVLLIVYATVLVLICSRVIVHESLDIMNFLMVNVGLLCLHLFLGTMCYLCACSFNEVKYSLGIGAGLSIAFILIQMLSQVSDKIEFLKYLTPLTLFDPKALASFDSMAMIHIVILLLCAIIMFIIASLIFNRRDLSL